MQMNRRNALAAFAAAAVPGAWAQDRYPSRPIRIIVTNAAGGASDMIARMIGTGLTRRGRADAGRQRHVFEDQVAL